MRLLDFGPAIRRKEGLENRRFKAAQPPCRLGERGLGVVLGIGGKFAEFADKVADGAAERMLEIGKVALEEL